MAVLANNTETSVQSGLDLPGPFWDPDRPPRQRTRPHLVLVPQVAWPR